MAYGPELTAPDHFGLRRTEIEDDLVLMDIIKLSEKKNNIFTFYSLENYYIRNSSVSQVGGSRFKSQSSGPRAVGALKSG